MGVEFSSLAMAGECGTVVASWGKHPARTTGAHSAGTAAPAKLMARGAQWRAEARGNVCRSASAMLSSGGTVAPAEQALRGAQTQGRVPTRTPSVRGNVFQEDPAL